MKHLLIAFTLITSVAFSDVLKEKGCFKIQGRIVDDEDYLSRYEVFIYEENTCIDSLIIKKSYQFFYSLALNRNFTVEVRKKGYFPKRITISTHVPHEGFESVYSLKFDLCMVKKEADIKDYYLDFPSAIILYNSVNKKFESKAEYQEHIYSKIKESIFKLN